MECEKFKEWYNLKFNCCESCHEDSVTGHGDDLWFTIQTKSEKKTWNICCAAERAFIENLKEK